MTAEARSGAGGRTPHDAGPGVARRKEYIMFEDVTVETDSGQTFRFNEAGAEWAGRSQVGRECADLFRLPNGVWVLRQGTGTPPRVIGAEEAKSWLEARPCAPFRATCLRVHEWLDVLANLRHGGSASAEWEVRALWRVMRRMVGAGLALIPPPEPTSLADPSARRAAVDEALQWCQELEARLATPATPPAAEERSPTPGKTAEQCPEPERDLAAGDYESVGKLRRHWLLYFRNYQALCRAMGDKVRTRPGTAKNPGAKNRRLLHRQDLFELLSTLPPLSEKAPAPQAAEDMSASETDAAKGKVLIEEEREREQIKKTIREENLRKMQGR
jgi:hypothetical protein